MIQVLSVLPSTRVLTGPNGFHVKGGTFVRNIYEPKERDIDFVVCLRVENEPPPQVEIEVFDPHTGEVYGGNTTGELEQVSPIYEVRVTVSGVILKETGEHAFKLFLNDVPAMSGPLWGYLQ
jgi:hypothetical protein